MAAKSMKNNSISKSLFIKYETRVTELTFWTRKWDISKSRTPLEYKNEFVNCKLFIKENTHNLTGSLKEIDVMPHSFLIMEFNQQHNIYKSFESNNSEINIDIAQLIYKTYLEFISKIEYTFHTIGNMEYCDFKNATFEDFFWKHHLFLDHPAERSHDNINYKKIIINEEKENLIWRNPLYVRKNLLDVKKWEKMKRNIDNITFDENVCELFKLKTHIIRYESRFSIVEACSLLELFFTEFITNKFKKIWLSNEKITLIKKNEIKLSQLINIYIPIILTNKEYLKTKKHLDELDKLRKLRNDIIHKKLRKIDINVAIKWIKSGIYLYCFLKQKKGIN